MSQVFVEHSQIQAYVESTTKVSKDTLFINVSTTKYPVTLAIQEDEEDKAQYILTKESAQKIFDWLRKKGIVN